MGESSSARAERELAALRSEIDRDVDSLVRRVKADLNPAALVRRQPIAVFGTLGSSIALGAAAIAKRAHDARTRRPDTEIERIIERLGGRVDKLKGRARKRFREQLRSEIGEVEKPTQAIKQAAIGMAIAAATAGATEFARKMALRLGSDDSPRRTK